MSPVDLAVLAGQTIGSADVVAVERVLAGLPTMLTDADQAYLDTRLTGNYAEAENVARALGLTQDAVLRRFERVKDRQRQRAAPSS